MKFYHYVISALFLVVVSGFVVL